MAKTGNIYLVMDHNDKIEYATTAKTEVTEYLIEETKYPENYSVTTISQKDQEQDKRTGTKWLDSHG